MKNKKIALLFVLPFVFSSCSGSRYVQFKSYTKDKDTYKEIVGEGYYKPAKFKNDYQEMLRSFPHLNSKKIMTIKSTGEQKLLVIPIEFKDSPCSSLNSGCNSTKNQIANSFFGADSRNSFRSVASYFNESSFGKLHLSGKVADWYTSKYSLKDVKENKDLVSKIVVNALEDYKTKNNDIKDFDNDKDGFVDGVAFIYSADYEKKNSSLWAYQSSVEITPNEDSPVLKTFLWASYQYLNTYDIFSTVDSHTYIHETGHLLGLKDYYSQDSSQKYKPLGGMDMMDYNLGDENTFTKMLLNWTRPYVITNEATITINASYKNGDCILIPAGSWNGSAMDEYILLELYSPNGLNKYDSNVEYLLGKEVISLMKEPGVKMFHVDARVAYYATFSSSPFIGYENDEGIKDKLNHIDEVGGYYYRDFAHSNTISESRDNNLLIRLLDKRGDKYLEQGMIATNDSLYKSNEGFTKSFTFNSGAELEYNIFFDNVTAESATIRLVKKK